ncbi:MAG: hypothetical protein ACRDK4_15025 [Solirubrobacteraceae bacterium]
MVDDSLFLGGTMRDRFLAVVAHDNETAAQRLAQLADGPEDLGEQRDEAWRLLSEGARWAAQALNSVGITGTDDTPIGDADAAFNRAQHLDEQLFKLGQIGRHDRVALLVDAVKRACYHGADLGPLPGGRLGSFRAPGERPSVVVGIEPHSADLQDVGGALGEALLRVGELHLGNPVDIADAALAVAA